MTAATYARQKVGQRPQKHHNQQQRNTQGPPREAQPVCNADTAAAAGRGRGNRPRDTIPPHQRRDLGERHICFGGGDQGRGDGLRPSPSRGGWNCRGGRGCVNRVCLFLFRLVVVVVLVVRV